MNKSDTKNIPVKKHSGVYGIHANNQSQILLILKSRGPYKGMYDLPGGTIECGETKEETLIREFHEEIGLNISSYEFLCEDTISFPHISQSEGKVIFHHTGFFYNVTLPTSTEIKATPDGHDSMGAIYIDFKKIIDGDVMVATMARRAIISSLKSQ